MIDEKNKLEAYLKTAKTIIAEERAKNKNPGASSSEVKNMKEQIKKKDEEIQKLKVNYFFCFLFFLITFFKNVIRVF